MYFNHLNCTSLIKKSLAFTYSKTRGVVLMAALIGVSSCSSLSIDHAEGRSPRLLPNEFFTGSICADGVVRNRSGEQIRSFNAHIVGSWDSDGTGTLDEVFIFDDGGNTEPVKETRVWTLKPTPGGYLASATDVPEPTLMEYAGNTIHMSYILNYGEPGDTISLSMDDWMFKVSDGVVINETRMSKFGFHVGQVLLVMRQVDESVDCLSGLK